MAIPVATAPSGFSLAAACLYIIVALGASLTGTRAVQHRGVSWHRWLWVMIALIFIGLAMMRVFAVEDWLRNSMRSVLHTEEAYADRRSLQRPLVAALLLMVLAVGAALLSILSKGVGGRRNIAVVGALGCTGAMIVLAALRLISLHSVDALLFGPLKVNWFLDLGLSIAVLACTWRYRTAEHDTSGLRSASS